MDSNEPIFQINELFDSFDAVKKKMELYTQTNKYKFTTANSKTFKNLPSNYNSKLIYDEKYYKCSVNPKKETLTAFEKANPGINVIQCPATIVLRTTSDKMHLKVTQLMLNHDHDSSDNQPRLKKYQAMVKNQDLDSIIQHEDEIGIINDIQLSRHSTEIDSVHHRQLEPTNLDFHIQPSTSLSAIKLVYHQQLEPTNQDLSQIRFAASSSLKQTTDGLTENIEKITDALVDIDDDFDTLLSKLKINISSTANKEERKNKVLRNNKMLASFDTGVDVFETQTINSTSSQSKIGSLSIHTSRARGRAKGRKNRAITLAAGKGNTALTFEQLREGQKKIFILKLIFADKKIVDRVLINHMKIKKVDLNHLKIESIPDALASETIELEIIQDYFDKDAFHNLNVLIIKKRKSKYWTCTVCKGELGTSASVECGKYLFWCHWICVGITEDPEYDWFCPNCRV
ncbi:hypothetical protein KQX54_010396 [Cotesia glomerata]|uniref:Zinc finger PHD-type domain-containing protein n=1 Tax=Cotesia glomerata TaxID=32391 RepID=A0AAV7HZE5_COTGL|nr:hypothetical protein KQX54_010396 [Cotesia glomerata]